MWKRLLDYHLWDLTAFARQVSAFMFDVYAKHAKEPGRARLLSREDGANYQAGLNGPRRDARELKQPFAKKAKKAGLQ